MKSKTEQVCSRHRWDRRLESHEGVECVVRVCERCGRTELCWSRKGMSAATVAHLTAKKHGGIGRTAAVS